MQLRGRARRAYTAALSRGMVLKAAFSVVDAVQKLIMDELTLAALSQGMVFRAEDAVKLLRVDGLARAALCEAWSSVQWMRLRGRA